MFPKREKIWRNCKANRVGHAALLALAAVSVVTALAHKAAAQNGFGDGWNEGEWLSWGGNPQNTHAGVGRQPINSGNANLLQQKWVFQTAGDVSATPTVSGGSVYVPDWGGYVYRIEAATGKAIWSRQLSEYTGNPKSLSRTPPRLGLSRLCLATMLSARTAPC